MDSMAEPMGRGDLQMPVLDINKGEKPSEEDREKMNKHTLSSQL
jgi:hypothetical protein